MSHILLSPTATLLATSAGLCVRSDLGTFQLAGADAAAFVEQVAPLCDGTRDRAAIVAALAGYSARSVNALLDGLADRGFTEEVSEGPPARPEQRGHDAFFRAWPDAPPGSALRLAKAGVLLSGDAPWIATAAAELSASGVGTVHHGDDPDPEGSPRYDLLLASRAPEHTERSTHLARAAHSAGLVSLWAHVDADHSFLGPLVTPGETACLACASIPALSPQPSATPASHPRHAIAAQLLGQHAALLAIQHLAGYTPVMLGGRLLVRELATLTSSRHTLVRLPWCPVCGE